MVFSEDSYNKRLPLEVHSRVLVGNWFEESVLQSTVGEARSVPQRHIKRAGLLRDFTKRPSEVRRLDDTFERVCGSASVAATTAQTTVEQPRAREVGPRRALEEAAFLKKAMAGTSKAKIEEEGKLVTEYEAANEGAKEKLGHSKAKAKEELPKKWVGKHTEFTHPIELQRRGGRFKDESGVRPNLM